MSKPKVPLSQRHRYRRDPSGQWVVKLPSLTPAIWAPCDEPEFYDDGTPQGPFSLVCFDNFDSLSIDFTLLGMEATQTNMQRLCAWLNEQWEKNPLEG